jgi:pantoate--beta-alanine ligase
MQIFTKIEALKAFLKEKRAQSKTVGLVPTMGALHAGHLHLVETCRSDNDITVSTIYVNPTQFNNARDLEKYPRTFERDSALLEKAGCDVLFYPSNQEMYEHPSAVKFDFGQLDKVLEGEFRPGHFSGVAVVVSKLFNLVLPDVAYFGQKDYQQFMVISTLVDELKFNLKLKCIPTQRESDGLAMSSRNLRLNEEERKKAIILFESLTLAREILLKKGSVSKAKEGVRALWQNQQGVKLDYFEAADGKNLNSLDNVEDAGSAVLLIAGYVGEIRLIDNLMLKEK